MKQYLELMLDIIENGTVKEDRTGTGVVSVFGRQLRFNLAEGFPLLTTKKLYTRAIVYELLWFLKGDTNIGYLKENNVKIWDDWADESGNLGPIYGKQWRAFGHGENTVDQISKVIKEIKENPCSRRLVVSAWDPVSLPETGKSPQENVENNRMALAPCHCLFQFEVSNNKLSCQLYQRSADYFLGVPFNIASYSLLLFMVAQQCDLDIGDYVHTFGNCHLYKNHLTQDIVYEQLNRLPRALPKLVIKRRPDTIFEYQYEDFEFIDYNPYPTIKAPISV